MEKQEAETDGARLAEVSIQNLGEVPFYISTEALNLIRSWFEVIVDILVEIKSLLLLKVRWENLHCISKADLCKLFSFGTTKVDELISQGVFRPINIPGHQRFNILDILEVTGIKYTELMAKLTELDAFKKEEEKSRRSDVPISQKRLFKPLKLSNKYSMM